MATIKEWIKTWSIKRIVDYAFSEGMRFQVNAEMKDEEFLKIKRLITKELKNRLTLKQ